jgi:hypothetical protein
MKHILVFDKHDEDLMKNGQMIQIPGQIETYISMEPKRSRANTVEVTNGHQPLLEHHRTKKSDSWPKLKCKGCGRSFKGGTGLSTHSRHCPGKP